MYLLFNFAYTQLNDHNNKNEVIRRLSETKLRMRIRRTCQEKYYNVWIPMCWKQHSYVLHYNPCLNCSALIKSRHLTLDTACFNSLVRNSHSIWCIFEVLWHFCYRSRARWRHFTLEVLYFINCSAMRISALYCFRFLGWQFCFEWQDRYFVDSCPVFYLKYSHVFSILVYKI